MSAVPSNATNLLVARESALGVPTTVVYQLEPNSYGPMGPEIKTVVRDPISQRRSRVGGGTVGLDSKAEFQSDLTMESALYWGEATLLSTYNGPSRFAGMDALAPTAVTSTGYTVPSGGDLPDGTLIYADGFTNDANNGLKVLAGTSTTTELKAAGLVAEAAIPAAQNVTVYVVGFQFAAGDLEFNGDGNLITTVKDLTALGLTAGQRIGIGGATGGLLVFDEAANRGTARVVSVATNLIVLDKKSGTFVVDDGGVQTVQMFFGPFLRDVAVTDADSLAAENLRTHTLERLLPGLAAGPADAYQYPEGCALNEWSVALALEDKVTQTQSFTSTDTPAPTTSRASGFSTPRAVVKGELFNTSSDIARLRFEEHDEDGLGTDFKSLTVKVKNNLNPRKVLGTLGATGISTGQLEVDIDMQVIIDSEAALAAVRDNTTVTLDFMLQNADGALAFDFPSVKLGNGALDFPRNEEVLINLTAQAVQDETYGTSMSISYFPYLPDDY